MTVARLEGVEVTSAAGVSLAELRSQTVWSVMAEACERFPERDALVGASDAGVVRRLTYRELAGRVRALSAGFAGMGMRRGDRMVLWCTNTPEWVLASFAAMRLGAAVVPVNTFLKPAEVKYLIAQSGARHLVMVDSFRALNMPRMLSEICPEFETATRPGALFSPGMPDLRNVVVFNRGGGSHQGAFDLAELAATGRDPARSADLDLADALEQECQPGDLAMVKYTSGSTGFPKGVMLEQGGEVACARLHSRRLGISSDDVFFSMMPFFHGGGSIWGLLTMMVNAGTLVFTEAFNPRLGARLVEQEQATVMFGVLVNEVAAAALEDGRDLSRPWLVSKPWRADASYDVVRRVFTGATFTLTPFGLTEAYGPAAVGSPLDPREKWPTSGRMLDGSECRVVNPETGLEVEPGEVGEAWIKGNIMRGYWNRPEETARAIDADGWLHSEDLVRMDSDGYITYVGRLKLMLKVGGENVSLEEVENVVSSHASVRGCAAVGTTDTRKGEAVRVYVVPAPDTDFDEAVLRAWLETRLARFKVPRDILVIDALPTLANGKIDRAGLKARSDGEHLQSLAAT